MADGFEKTDEAIENILAIVKLGRAERAKQVEAVFREHGIVSTGYVAQILGLPFDHVDGMLRNMKGVRPLGMTRDGALWCLEVADGNLDSVSAVRFLSGVSP